MSNAGVTIDLITLQQHLKDKEPDRKDKSGLNHLESVGGIAYLVSLQDSVPSAANLSRYAGIIADKYLLRKMVKVCSEAVGRVYDYEGQVELAIDEFERNALSIRPGLCSSARNGVELVKVAMDRIELLHGRGGAIGGISTGLNDLDKLVDGLHPGELIVLAAWPAVGKSSLALNIAEANVLAGIPVGVFSLEMQADELMCRMMCSHARVNLRDIRDGIMTERDFPRLTSAAGRLSKAPVYIDDSGDQTAGQIRAKARRMVQQHGVKLFVVDYLQLVTAPEVRKNDNREQEVSHIASSFKAAAKELKVPFLTLSQLNDDGKLRESRAIGQHADGIWVLDNDEKVEGLVHLVVRKQRNGPTGKIPLTFRKEYTRFEQAAKEQDTNEI